MKLRFIERIDEFGTLRRILQTREEAYLPWEDVPCLTLADQLQDSLEREADADVRDYG